MPLSEFLRLAIEKLESSRKKSCLTDLSSPRAENNNDLVRDDEDIGNPSTRSVGNFGEIEEGNLGLNQNDEIVPWLSFSADDDGMQDYCSELLPEISDVTGDGILPGNSSEQTVINLETDFKITSSPKSRPVCSWLNQQGQTPDPRVSNIVGTYNDINTSNDNNSRDSTFFNFSNFSRPLNPVKDNLENSKGSACRCNNKAVRLEKFNNLQKDTEFQVPCAPTVIKPRKFGVKESFRPERTENLVHEKREGAQIQRNGVIDTDRVVEPVVTSSSVGSGNSADRVSYDQTHNSKRKFVDVEEFECHSEDVETESLGAKKRAPARGGSVAKRSRAAEVHNLSERRRRDRINEKMRALQELIPNCNKADKASMLDEAIEYLKNLQLQVQMMSMGASVCMPQMMFHPHFSSMGVGMGMRFGMGMPMQGPHFPSSASALTNFPSSNIRAPLLPLTAAPQVPSMISSALMVPSHNERKNSDCKDNNGGSNQSAAVHEINEAKDVAKDVGSNAALTSTTSKRGG